MATPHNPDFEDDDGDLGLAEAPARPEIKEPPLFKVVLINDDYTPMDFVVEILRLYFGMSDEQSFQVMIDIHKKGKGVAGVFTRDIAETRVEQVNGAAQANGHPLKSLMEEA